jgi:hypothetical protein
MRLLCVTVTTALALASAWTGDAYGDCTCRALGQDFPLGYSACLATPAGPRVAVCGMVLNNTSWRISQTPCVFSKGKSEPGDARAMRHAFGIQSGG